MCLSKISTDASKLKWRVGADGREYIDCYKVYTRSGVKKLSSPFFGCEHWKSGTQISHPGLITSTRLDTRLYWSERGAAFGNIVKDGFHVYPTHDKVGVLGVMKKFQGMGYTGGGDLVCIKVRCYKQDFVAVGKFDYTHIFSYSNSSRKNQVSSAVFTKIEILERVWNSVFA